MTEQQIDREMAFASQPHADYRCKDLRDIGTWCQRERGHEGEHAAGYGTARVRWMA